jgi:hypothetical protein
MKLRWFCDYDEKVTLQFSVDDGVTWEDVPVVNYYEEKDKLP